MEGGNSACGTPWLASVSDGWISRRRKYVAVRPPARRANPNAACGSGGFVRSSCAATTNVVVFRRAWARWAEERARAHPQGSESDPHGERERDAVKGHGLAVASTWMRPPSRELPPMWRTRCEGT
jgi:hypothetical protein